MEPEPRRGVQRSVRQLNWTTIALIGGLVLLVFVIAYFATRGSSDQDKLTTANVATSSAPNHEKLCASQATYELIKRDLFRRAAQVRRSDQAAFDQISGAAVVRMENPVMESEDSGTGAVHCSGSLSVDLPPGVAVVGGRRTLAADVDYTVQQAADGSGPVVLLTNADAIVTPLATLTREAAPPPEANNASDQNVVVTQPPATNQGQPAAQLPAPEPAQPPSTTRPSFSCANARSNGEIAICSDPNLAALDRDMSSEYGRAASVATPDQRALLRNTAHRFYAFRDRCPDRRCVAAAYTGRIREIHDIIEGRWQPPR
jgi:hypothetical protein